MKAIDTCVLARYIVADDPIQRPLANRQMAEGGFIAITVVLELGWLLRSKFGYTRDMLADTLHDIISLPNIVVAEESAMRWVIERIRAGADVGDMIHLVASYGCESFVTFDKMVAQAGDKSPLPIELLR